MKTFSDICDAINKAMLEMAASGDYKGSAETFLNKIALLENAFSAATTDPILKNNRVAPFEKLIALGKNITQFLQKLADNNEATFKSLSFLQSHFSTILSILEKVSTLKPLKERRGFLKDWNDLLLVLNGLLSDIKTDVIKNRIFALTPNGATIANLGNESDSASFSEISDISDSWDGSETSDISNNDVSSNDASNNDASTRDIERNGVSNSSVSSNADISSALTISPNTSHSAPCGQEILTTVELIQRFNTAFALIDGSSDLTLVTESLAILETILLHETVHLKDAHEAETLRANVFTEELGDKLDNLALSLELPIEQLRRTDISQYPALNNNVNRLEKILDNHIFKTFNISPIDDVQARLAGIKHYMATNPDFADVLRVVAMSVAPKPATGKIAQNVSASLSSATSSTATASTVTIPIPSVTTAADTKTTNEVETLRRCASAEGLLEYFNIRQQQGHIWSKQALLYIINVMSNAKDNYQNTFDKHCALGNAQKKVARRPWEVMLEDIGNEKNHLEGTIRKVLEEITARLDTFNMDDISRLAEHLSNCRILHTGLFQKFENLLLEKIFKFDIKTLDETCATVCEQALRSMSNVIYTQKRGSGRKEQQVDQQRQQQNEQRKRTLLEIESCLDVTRIANIADFLEKMRGQNSELIHRTVALSAMAISNTVQKPILCTVGEPGAVEAAGSIGKLAHSLGILSHYLPTQAEGVAGLNAQKVIKQLVHAVLIYGKRVTTQILQDNNMDARALANYRRGVHSLAHHTRQYVDQRDLHEFQGFLQECYLAAQQERNDLEQSRFANNVAYALERIYGLTKKEGINLVSNGKPGARREYLHTEHLLPPFQYDFLLSLNKYFYTIEANGRAYHYLITLFPDNRPPIFTMLDGKSLLKKNLVHRKRLTVDGKRLCLPHEFGKRTLAIDIHQSLFEEAQAQSRDRNFIRHLLEQETLRFEAEEKARLEREKTEKAKSTQRPDAIPADVKHKIEEQTLTLQEAAKQLASIVQNEKLRAQNEALQRENELREQELRRIEEVQRAEELRCAKELQREEQARAQELQREEQARAEALQREKLTHAEALRKEELRRVEELRHLEELRRAEELHHAEALRHIEALRKEELRQIEAMHHEKELFKQEELRREAELRNEVMRRTEAFRKEALRREEELTRERKERAQHIALSGTDLPDASLEDVNFVDAASPTVSTASAVSAVATDPILNASHHMHGSQPMHPNHQMHQNQTHQMHHIPQMHTMIPPTPVHQMHPMNSMMHHMHPMSPLYPMPHMHPMHPRHHMSQMGVAEHQTAYSNLAKPEQNFPVRYSGPANHLGNQHPGHTHISAESQAFTGSFGHEYFQSPQQYASPEQHAHPYQYSKPHFRPAHFHGSSPVARYALPMSAYPQAIQNAAGNFHQQTQYASQALQHHTMPIQEEGVPQHPAFINGQQNYFPQAISSPYMSDAPCRSSSGIIRLESPIEGRMSQSSVSSLDRTVSGASTTSSPAIEGAVHSSAQTAHQRSPSEPMPNAISSNATVSSPVSSNTVSADQVLLPPAAMERLPSGNTIYMPIIINQNQFTPQFNTFNLQNGVNLQNGAGQTAVSVASHPVAGNNTAVPTTASEQSALTNQPIEETTVRAEEHAILPPSMMQQWQSLQEKHRFQQSLVPKNCTGEQNAAKTNEEAVFVR